MKNVLFTVFCNQRTPEIIYLYKDMTKINKENKRNFLLGFFKNENSFNETLELNGFVLFKHWDGNNLRCTVDIFTPESYQNMMKNKITQKETLFK